MDDSFELKVGSLVIAKRDVMLCKKGDLGVCVEEYRIEGRPGWGILFENGSYDGFSPDDVRTILMIANETCESVDGYEFADVGKLAEDHRRGHFDAAFAQAKRLLP